MSGQPAEAFLVIPLEGKRAGHEILQRSLFGKRSVGIARRSRLEAGRVVSWLPRTTKSNPFRYFKTSPDIIRLEAILYVRFPLSLRNVADLLHERGIEITRETVRF